MMNIEFFFYSFVLLKCSAREGREDAELSYIMYFEKKKFLELKDSENKHELWTPAQG